MKAIDLSAMTHSEIVYMVLDHYRCLVAWIGSGSLVSREFSREAYRQRGVCSEILQEYSGVNLEGIDLILYVAQKIQATAGA